MQTIQAALQIRHPVEFASPIPDLLARCVIEVLNMGPATLAESRASILNDIVERRKHLATREAEVLESIHCGRSSCSRLASRIRP